MTETKTVSDVVPIRSALISVSDKLGLADFALGLHRAGVRIYSTGGTAETIRGSGIPVVDVWRRFEVSGRIARHLVGAADYAALYDILERNGMSTGFLPHDIAKWVWDG